MRTGQCHCTVLDIDAFLKLSVHTQNAHTHTHTHHSNNPESVGFKLSLLAFFTACHFVDLLVYACRKFPVGFFCF